MMVNDQAGGGAAASPEQLLAERFAHGDIDEEDYRRRLAAPHASGPPTKP